MPFNSLTDFVLYISRLQLLCFVTLFLFCCVTVFVLAAQKPLAIFHNFHPFFLHPSLLDIFWNFVEYVVCLGNETSSKSI